MLPRLYLVPLSGMFQCKRFSEARMFFFNIERISGIPSAFFYYNVKESRGLLVSVIVVYESALMREYRKCCVPLHLIIISRIPNLVFSATETSREPKCFFLILKNLESSSAYFLKCERLSRVRSSRTYSL